MNVLPLPLPRLFSLFIHACLSRSMHIGTFYSTIIITFEEHQFAQELCVCLCVLKSFNLHSYAKTQGLSFNVIQMVLAIL